MAETHFGYQTIDENEKTARVGEVFSSVAKKYDVMNDVMSFGIHRLWKDWFVWQTDVQADERVLDLAAGTGDITARIAKKMCGKGVDISGKITVSDINEEMLEVGKKRLLAKGWAHNLEFVIANAEELPFEDNSFDLVTMAFGLRNVTHQQKALNEIYRVLKKGGRVLVLEFSAPQNPVFSKVYDWYSFTFLPKMGEVIAKDAASYQYLAESIRMKPKQEELKNMFIAAGFNSCEYQNMTNGIVAIHKGVK